MEIILFFWTILKACLLSEMDTFEFFYPITILSTVGCVLDAIFHHIVILTLDDLKKRNYPTYALLVKLLVQNEFICEYSTS